MKYSSRFTIAVVLTMLFASVTAFSQAKPREERLLNGLKLLMWRDSSATDATVRIRIHSGAAFDPQGKEGVMRLLADNIFPTEATREFFSEELGGGLTVTTNYDYIEINARGRSDALLTMIETLSAAVANPTIDKPTTAKLKENLAKTAKDFENDPSYVASLAANKRLFGTFPYGRPMYGSSESIAKIDFADLIDAKLKFLTADNATVAVSGNFDPSFAYKAVRRLFGAWLKSDRRVPSTFRQPDDPPAGMLTLPSPVSDKSAIRFAARGVSRADSNF
ncbi:MAG TPA: insulinase family protein, partial [Pyrinomonadaceae bacterium]|nr:insulinase family protein [Pyrinomonadaceae bacterium]